MKTKLLIFIFSCMPILLRGQEKSVDSLLHEIDSIRATCEQLKNNNKDKIKGYEQALILQDSVYNLMADSIRYFSAFEKDARTYEFFVCTDASIFSQKYAVIDIRRLPKYMQEHYLAITTIRQFAQCIENMENKVKDAESDNDVVDTDKKNFVALKIKSEIDKANDLLDKIDKLNMSSLEKDQSNFYQVLSERLTNILNKYIF